MRLGIGAEILQDKVDIRTVSVRAGEQGVINVAETLRIIRRVEAVDQLHEHAANLLIRIEDIHRVVAAVLLVVNDLVRRHTEDERIVLADFVHNLDVCAVHRTEGRCAVQHELHVRSAGRLLTCGRNLLRDICCRKDNLCARDTVILDEDNLDFAVDRCVVVDHIRHGID